MRNKTALSHCIGPKGEQNYESPIARKLIDGAAEYVSTADHYMRPGKQDKPGRIKVIDERYGKKKEAAELERCIEKVASARFHRERVYWTKQASSLMGRANDMELEDAVFRLSSHFIKDKAPKLFDMNYFVGFRILDKSDDNTKVVGIYGFKIGKTWAYIPIFFDKGKLNGYELLYIQNKDQFVPLKEGWVDWVIKNAGDEAFGREDDKDFRQLGIRYPDMKQLTQPPVLGKVASVQGISSIAFTKLLTRIKTAMPNQPNWVVSGVAHFTKCAAATDTELNIDLEKIGSRDPRIFARLAMACDKYPIMKVAMEAVYGEGVFDRMYGSIMRQHQKRASAPKRFWEPERPKEASVRVITRRDKAAFPYLNEKQASDLIENGNMVIDFRDDDAVSRLDEEIKLTSPHKTGVYDVFCADGTLRECLVICNPLLIKGVPARELCLVVDWKRRKHVFAKAMAVLAVRGSYKDDWFNRLPADQFKSGTSMRDSTAARADDRVIITSDGRGTVPLELENCEGAWRIKGYNESSDNRDRTYDIDEGINWTIGRMQPLIQQNSTREGMLDRVRNTSRVRWLICAPGLTGNNIIIRDDKMILPTKFKYIDLDPDPDVKWDKRKGTALVLATENDVMGYLYGNRKKLKAVKGNGDSYTLDGKTSNKEAAFKSLVLDYHFREKIARDILEASEIAKGLVLHIPYVTPRYKQAELPIDPMFLRDGMLSQMSDNTMSPVFQDNPIGYDGYSGLPVQEGFDEAQQLGFEGQPVPPEFLNEVPPPDPMAMQQAQEAAATGRKDVFDVSILAGLLKTNRSDELINEYTKTFKQALSHVGRTMFKLFWDRESFVDRFGEEDMEKFEDLLSDVFSNLGDLVLYLTSKDDRPEVSDFLDGIGEQAM